MYFFKKLLLILPLLFGLAAAPCYGEDVVFIHRTEKKINTNCRKFKGKHDISPTYKCFDKDGNSYDPLKDWEEAEITDVCFQHKVNDAIKIVKKVIEKQSKIERFFEVDKEGNLTPFDPGEIWKPMNESDCNSIRKDRKTIEVPKGISDF